MALRSLAASLRGGFPPRLALETWHEDAPAELEEPLGRLARRLRLGEGAASAVLSVRSALGDAADGLAAALQLNSDSGASLPAMVDSLGSAVEIRHEMASEGRAATAGARLSARLVAGLPLAFVPLMPGGGLPGGRAELALFLIGAGLAVAGLWWIGRLLPDPDRADDGSGAFAEAVAIALAGGADLIPAVEAATAHPPPVLAESLELARLRVTSGEGWYDALRASGVEGLESVGRVVERARSFGIPARAALEECASAQRARLRTEFERSVKRAPVLMVVPLTVCILPAFALLSFGPLLLQA